MKTKIEVVKNMGISWTLFRAKYELKKKLGLLKKQYPVFSYSDIELSKKVKSNKSIRGLVEESLEKSFFRPNYEEIYKLRGELDLNDAIREADDILNGKFNFFSKHLISFEEVDWHYNPLSKRKSPPKKHWTEISDLSSDFGDIKWIWELSRFTFVYPLCRAYSITNDTKYAKRFWGIFEDFIEHNPPELGVNYKCGQEMSLRVMAWIFGLNVFLNSDETTDERIELMMNAINHHTDHIEKHFDFALKSVKNNHSLTEAACMYTVGKVFPFFNLSRKWSTKGKTFFQSESNWQIYNDGSYIQHSFNYQRLAIQDLTWVFRLAQLNQDEFDDAFSMKFKETVKFLYQMQESENGSVPNYGMNDGAYIQPLTSRAYSDYRPVLQAAWLTLTGKRLYEDKEVDEIALWFGVNTREQKNAPLRKSTLFPEGGYATLRDENQFALIRCATYKHRPAQADMMHLDFWDGQYNILADAGTFSYNTTEDVSNYFNGTRSHNTIMVNDCNQMKKASRFIWLNWTKSRINYFHESDIGTFFEGEHYGYAPLTHRRAIYQSKDIMIVIDDLVGEIEESNVSLSWLFGVKEVIQKGKLKWEITLPDNTTWVLDVIGPDSSKSTMYNGSTVPFAGWRSLYYGYKEVYPQLIIDTEIKRNSRFITVLRKNTCKNEPLLKDDLLLVGDLKLILQPISSKTVFKHMEL